jgi:biopolymer transport protein ExbD
MRKKGLSSRKLIKAAPVKNEINVTPLVDVCLVLLIIFMVVTPMLHRNPDVEPPATAHHDKKSDTGEDLMVTVRKDGTYIETTRLQGEALVARIKQEMQKDKSRPIHLKADKSLRYGDVRKVLEQINESGVQQVGMGTEALKG